MRASVAIIGGTGVGDRLLELGGSSLFVPTAEGLLRGRLIEHQGVGVLLVSRHSAGHKTPPHKVNYRAIALGLKAIGIQTCFASAAVGCLNPDWLPGTLVACADFYDLTARNQTLFDRQVVHTDFSEPFAARARKRLLEAGTKLSIPVVDGGVYVGLNGPRYETPQEIRLISSLGGELVGMTASTEAILMREAGVAYATLAVVTNLAAGMTSEPLSHEEVVAEMMKSGARAVQILLAAAVASIA